MLISYTHKFIFFHVPKVAGLSIRSALADYTQEPPKFRIKRPAKTLRNGKLNPLYQMWASFLLHANARTARKELPKEVFENFYKFAFVRNPWDWQVSMYHFILKEPEFPNHDLIKSLGGFEAFLSWLIRTENPYPKNATKFQKNVVTEVEGNLMVDFVGHYENLATDFQRVCQRLNIDAELPHLNRSKHRDYRTYYNERTRQMVAEYFQEDIALFGYTFEG